MEWQQLGDRHRSALQRRQRALPGQGITLFNEFHPVPDEIDPDESPRGPEHNLSAASKATGLP
jgi:hypothetical protein